MTTLDILYRDEHLLAINKPSGLLVHRSRMDNRERRFAMQLLRDQIGQHVFPCHRLDKPTSGVLVFALNARVANAMMESFRGRGTRKIYHAVARGYVDETGRIDYTLKEMVDTYAEPLADPDKDSQSAVTDYRCLRRVELAEPVGRYQTARYSLVELRPHTGRRHQLRRHLRHVFHPIVGDTTHGDGRHNRFFRERFGSHRLLLHASSIEFQHPVDCRPVRIEASPEMSFIAVTSALGWPAPAECTSSDSVRL